MPIDFKSETWKQVAADARARMENAVAALIRPATNWEGVLAARAQYREAERLLSKDPDFKKPTWSNHDD